YGDKIADLIDEEVNKIIQQAYEAARKILTENKAKLVLIAERLVAQETLEGEKLEALFKKPSRKPKTKVITTTTPVPIEPVAESEPAPKPKPKKSPAMPYPLPKQAPAASD
ncbi:cell division protein FtsH, partial [Chloroflexota bacterium]